MKSTHNLLLSLLVPVVVFSGLFGGPILAAKPTDAPPASISPNEGQGLIITTHGSVWFFRDDVWRYPAFKNFEDSFDFINTVEVEEILAQYSELTLGPYQSMQLTFELSQEIEDALIFHLSGTTPGYNGLRLPMTVTDPEGIVYRSYNHISERSLHIDQPILGQYQIGFYTDSGADFSLTVGTGRSPFLTTYLPAYAFLLIPDSDPLTSREIESVKQFVERGGKLILLADLIRAPRYFSSSNFDALNALLADFDVQFTGELLTTSDYVMANNCEINVLTNIVPHQITQGITKVISTGSTLVLTGSAQGLVFDDEDNPAIAVGDRGWGQYLAVGTGIGFNADFRLRENDPLAENIVQWARAPAISRIYLPLVSKSYP